jgi:hypothetical protein
LWIDSTAEFGGRMNKTVGVKPGSRDCLGKSKKHEGTFTELKHIGHILSQKNYTHFYQAA